MSNSAKVSVAKLFAVPLIKKEKFYKSIKLAIGKTIRREMVSPTFLAIEEKLGKFWLYRYTEKGKKVGSTEHDSEDMAKAQAKYEFDGYYSDWQEVPVNLINPLESIMDHLGLFEIFYRVLLAADCIPPSLGEKVAKDVTKGFSKRPWDKNVYCFWEGPKNLLFLWADHPYDDNGVIVGTEFVEEIIKSLKVPYIDERSVRIVQVEKFRLNQ